MKRGALNFWGRKNQSLFDTNIKIKDMDNVELSLESSAIPESGTASVRARPTVKHHTSPSFDSFQGYAVPTPKVPLLPSVNGPKTNGSIGGNQLLNGSVISVPDLVEGEIFVPPPPSMAPPPPPPPETFIPPPPDFMGDLKSPDLLQPPSMTALKLPSLAPSMEEEDVTFLKPPARAPPKPPSTSSSSSTSSIPISCPPPDNVPEHPKFAPPQPPAERQHKAPPLKPIRLSSMSNLDSPPHTPVPPPSVQTPTLSTFNPQNTAKLYSVPQTSILSGYDNRDTRPKQMLLLEDSGPVTSVPVLVQVDGNTSKVVTPSKPVPKDVQELNVSLQIPQPPQSLLPESNTEAKTGTVSGPPEIGKSLGIGQQTSPQLQKVNSTEVNSESSKDKQQGSPSQSHKFSPILDHKLRTLKSSETNKAREGPVASPLALLMAAKQREKHRSTHSVSRENSTKKTEQPCASIQPSNTSPNSFVVTPTSSSSSSLTSQDTTQDSPMSVSPVEQTIQITEKSSSPTLVKDQRSSNSAAWMASSPSMTTLLAQSSTNAQSAQHEDNKEELNMPLLPPPPEFDDLEEIMGPPPSIPPPDPPMKKAPTPTSSPLPPPQAPSPPPAPKPKPPAAPKLPPLNIDVKPKPQVQTKPTVAISQPPPTLSPSQATLLSILQKKMLEMDHKMAPVNEAQSSSDDWGGPLSDEDNKVPVVPRTAPQSKNYPVVNKAATLDMRELEGKVIKKYQESSSKVPTSNGLQSKHQYGMTFTIRPGTKQPITVVSKGDS